MSAGLSKGIKYSTLSYKDVLCLLQMCSINFTEATIPSHPITSYGIISVYKSPDNGNYKFLIYQRRDNYEYIDILKGNWNTDQRLSELVSALSRNEYERLLKYSFEDLWNDLWIDKHCKIRMEPTEKYKRKFEIAKHKFQTFPPPKNMDHNDPPWGFPKGRKLGGNRETEIECAIREFCEEVRIPLTKVNILNPFKSFMETYKGNNGKLYRTYYYVAEVTDITPIVKFHTPDCIRKEALSEEAADAQWVTIEEALYKLNTRRMGILKKVLTVLQERSPEKNDKLRKSSPTKQHSNEVFTTVVSKRKLRNKSHRNVLDDNHH